MFRRHHARAAVAMAALIAFAVVAAHTSAEPGADEASATGTTKQSVAAVVQLLVYAGDDLLNQGSGVVVAEGMLVTSAQLLRSQSRLVVVTESGVEHEARVITTDAPSDIALLRVVDATALGVAPLSLARSPAVEGELLQVTGFWSADPEAVRKSSLFGAARPRFQAARQSGSRVAKGLVDVISTRDLVMLASIGRGAYGAPVMNRCGQLVGVVHAAESMTDELLWQRHELKPKVAALPLSGLEQFLAAQGVDSSRAEAVCKSEAETKLDEARRLEEQSQKRETEAQKRQREAERRAEEAEKKADQVEREKREAEQDAERNQRDSTELVQDLSKEVERQIERIGDTESSRERLLQQAAVAGLVLVLVIAGLWWKRRRDLQRAGLDLAKARARFSDCLLEGRGVEGAPIAVKISGADLLASPQGLILGRNPDLANVVISDETVSRRHARLRVVDGALTIEDLGSTGGTRVNGTRIEPGSVAALASGDLLGVGQSEVRLRILES